MKIMIILRFIKYVIILLSVIYVTFIAGMMFTFYSISKSNGVIGWKTKDGVEIRGVLYKAQSTALGNSQ